MQQAPVFDAGHAGHGERLRQPQYQRSTATSTGRGSASRARPLSRLRSGSIDGVDAVVEHVVVPQRVVAVEAAARRELADRRIERDGAPILPAEQR